jgi:hypothetical protein
MSDKKKEANNILATTKKRQHVFSNFLFFNFIISVYLHKIK